MLMKETYKQPSAIMVPSLFSLIQKLSSTIWWGKAVFLTTTVLLLYFSADSISIPMFDFRTAILQYCWFWILQKSEYWDSDKPNSSKWPLMPPISSFFKNILAASLKPLESLQVLDVNNKADQYWVSLTKKECVNFRIKNGVKI